MPATFQDRRLVAWLIGVGAACVLAVWIDVVVQPRLALPSYLVAFAFWCSVTLGSLGWLMTFHAGKSRWVVAVRRPLEALAATSLAMLVLFAPIAARLGALYEWVHPAPRPPEEEALLAFQRGYLHAPFFIGRTLVYFAFWIVFGALLWRWSRAQDESRAPELTARQRRLSGGGLVVLALTGTFAAIDWIMSLEPAWHSTTFGFYYLSGALVAGMALLILVVTLADRTGRLGVALLPAHYHNLGKLLFAAVCFWAYIAFTQYLLVWIGNEPDEITWFVERTEGGWKWVAILLVVVHFALPFLILLSRDVKRQRPLIAAMAAWLFLAHYLDVYWLVMPHLYPAAPHPRWTDLAAFAGMGGLVLGFAALRQLGAPAVPVGDPYLAESLRYDRS
ncbi:MAG TPA: hypothetical protein VMB50_13945 [Myxococcales bacterium]|nr:hypothetical protein [Myxococcales bacterium]